ncbi:MAG: hypothetical protein PHY13_05410 [Clostridia bacterium]|nr:hypothetical protein [Clostridia bacterium]MDD4543188.1 hypothetical protein [Clostridia bacterium]
MKYEITNHFPNEIIYEEEGPFVSLYQPTHRSFPENKQDTIVFGNLLRVIENSFNMYNKDLAESILKPLYKLEKDLSFWNNTLDGIAVLASKNKCVIYNLQSPVKEFVSLADSFHIKPLIMAFQSLDSYQVLGLSRNNFSIYQGNRYGFLEIELAQDVPRKLEDVLGKDLTEPYLSHGSYGGTGGSAMYHGHADNKFEIDKDTEKYFRYVGKYVYENFSKPSKLPLILISLKEYHSLFKDLSNNKYLINECIDYSYDSLTTDDIKTKVADVINSINSEKISGLVESFKNAEAESLASSDIINVSKAAFEGRIKTVLIEKNKTMSGKINHSNGSVEYQTEQDNSYSDLLDNIAQLVLLYKGEVFILPKDKMPSKTGISAIFRYI